MPAAIVGTVPANVKDTNGGVTAVTMPVHRKGDLILIGVVSRSTTGISADGGFAEVFEGSTTNPHCALYAKVATSASETCSITSGADDCIIQAFRVAYHGVRAGFETTDIQKGTEATATSATFDPPNLSFGATYDSLVLSFAGFAWTAGTDVINNGPSGFTTIVNDKSAATTTSVGIYLGWQDNPAISSLNPGAGSNTNRVWRAQTFFIPPATYITGGENFGAANGAAWPEAWVTSFLNGPGTMDIQSEVGRALTNSGTAFANTAMAIRAFPHEDIMLIAKCLVNGSNPGIMGVYARADGNWSATGNQDPSNGYTASFQTDEDISGVLKYVAGAETSLSAPAYTNAPGTTHYLKFILLGTTIRYRIWDAAGAEPTTWAVQTTDSSISSGTHIQLKAMNEASGAATDGRFSQIRWYDLAKPPRPSGIINQNRALQAVTRAAVH